MLQMRWTPETLDGWALEEIADQPPAPSPKRTWSRKPKVDPRQVAFDEIGWRPAQLEPHQLLRMPTTRAECQGDGVCLKLSCRYNTTVDITRTGSIHLSTPRSDELSTLRLRSGKHVVRLSQAETEAFEDRVIERIAECETNCALDAVDREPDGMTLEAIGESLGIVRERARQVEEEALAKLRAECDEIGLRFEDFLESWRGNEGSDD